MLPAGSKDERHLRNSKLTSIVLVISATLLWSIGAPISKYVSSSVMTLIFFRSLSGVIALAVASFIFRGNSIKRPKRLSIISGAFYAATSLCFYAALSYTTAANATVLANTSPLFIAFLGIIFLNEKPTQKDWFILLIIMIGIVLCFKGGVSIEGSKGDIFALLAALSFSVLAILIKKSSVSDTMQALFWGNLIAVLVTLPYQLKVTVFFPEDIGLFIVLGVFQMALPFFLYIKGQEKLGAMEASLFKLLEPILAPLWVALIIGEFPSVFSIVGGILVIASLFYKILGEYSKSIKKAR